LGKAKDMITSVKDSANAVKDALKSDMSGVSNEAKNMITSFKDSANAVKDALKSNMSGLSNKVKDVMDSVKPAIQEELNIKKSDEEKKQIKTVSTKDMITEVLNKYLQLLKDGKSTGETNKKGESIILMLNDTKRKNDIIAEMVRDKEYEPYVKLWKAIGPLTEENFKKITQEKQLNRDIQNELDEVLNEFNKASDIVKEISEKLRQPVIQKQLSKKQIEQIEKILSNQDSMLGSLSKNLTSGLESFGSWLIPTVTTDASGNPIKEHNETAVHFLWYPRMHKKYRKGNSSAETFNRYGDFMVYIEPEKYSSTSEFIVQSTDSVDDLLANVLNGHEKSAIPEPYKHRIYKIQNYQPFFDKVPPANEITK
jgi:phage-related protein